VDIPKPARLNALTGLRCFAAVNIVLFHFSNPQWFGWLAPVVNAGYVSVSYFILLSGFVLGYNYNVRARAGELDKVRFWKARFTRIYPIYLLSLLLSWGTLGKEYGSHTHGMFWTGMVLTPLLLQGWIPAIATFLNTPAWTMSAESFYYVIFPWLARWKRPERVVPHLWKMAGIWALGLIPGLLYMVFNPDGIAHPDRFSYGRWLWALKYTPYSHVASFIFGVMLAELDELMTRDSRLRLWLGLGGFAGIYGLLTLGPLVPYAIMHDGLLMPLLRLHRAWPGREEPAGYCAGMASAGLCGRGQLLPLSAPLQPVEPDSRLACAGPPGPDPIRPVAQLRAADRAGRGGAALGGKASAAATAQVDGGVEQNRN
jgi:peptidoglycan/LPS O-acetylase OafA/YrhL